MQKLETRCAGSGINILNYFMKIAFLYIATRCEKVLHYNKNIIKYYHNPNYHQAHQCCATAAFSLVLADAWRLWFGLTCAISQVQISTKFILFTTVIRNPCKG